jgi:thiamine pyrophosphate-dependent acetolactate synthase large subunit-like protein
MRIYMRMTERAVSEVIVDQLAAWDVEYVLGLPGD